jgi:hypothetical protein
VRGEARMIRLLCGGKVGGKVGGSVKVPATLSAALCAHRVLGRWLLSCRAEAESAP